MTARTRPAILTPSPWGRGLLGSVRAAATSDWRELSRTGRVAAIGVALSAVLALALGTFIPGVVERHAVQTSLDANVATVRLLEHHLPDAVSAAAATYDELDEIVQHELLGGPNLHTLLWNLDGDIVYADRPTFVGQSFPMDEGLTLALNGRPMARMQRGASLLAPTERGSDGRWLDFYVPATGPEGAVLGAFQIQQDIRPLAAHLRAVQQAVWLAVGSGLTVLLVFLWALFAATNHAITRRKDAAEQRASDLAVLLETSQLVAVHPALDGAAPLVLERLIDHLELDGAAIAVPEPGGGLALGWSAGKIPRGCLGVAEEALRGPGAASGPSPCRRCDCISHVIPLGEGPPHIGALVARRSSERPFTAHEGDLLATLAGQIGVAVANTNLFERLREAHDLRGNLLRRLVTAQEQERHHLVGELHDDLGQSLTRVLYGLRGTRSHLDGVGDDVLTELGRLETIVEDQSRSLRRYLGHIAPASLDGFGVRAALRSLADEHEGDGLTVHVDCGRTDELEHGAAITLYRAAQEAVTNVRKHADTDEAWVGVTQGDGHVQLTIEDHGVGAETIEEGVGLSYMRERIESLGGSVAVSSRPGHGTRVVLRLPTEDGHVAAARADR
jgi:signal transduction histidine kinase